MKQKMFLFMVAGPVQCELCVTPGRLMIHTVSVAELELGQEGGAAPATTFSKTVSFSFLFLSFFHIHSSRTHQHRGRTTQSVSLKNVFPISAFYFLFLFFFFFTYMWRKYTVPIHHLLSREVSCCLFHFCGFQVSCPEAIFLLASQISAEGECDHKNKRMMLF